MGPSSAPNISAPIKSKIDALKRKAGHDKFIVEYKNEDMFEEDEYNFFEKIINWFNSWF